MTRRVVMTRGRLVAVMAMALGVSILLSYPRQVAAKKTKEIRATDVGSSTPEPPRAQAEAPAQEKERQPKLKVEVPLEIGYTSNLYHLSARRAGQFDTKSDPGERFAGMRGPADIVVAPAVELSLRWPVSKKRDLTLGLAASYANYLRNRIANYFAMEAKADYELTGDDKAAAFAGFIPRRFKKNYASEIVGGNKLFEPAHYREVELGAEYEHEWTQDLASAVEYVLALRSFDAPFENRDLDTHEVLLSSSYRFYKKSKVKAGVGFARAIAPAKVELDPNLVVDRSFSQWLATTELSVDLPDGFGAELELEYRVRNFTSDVAGDDAHYNRSDGRLALAVGVEKRFKVGLLLAAKLAWLRNRSDRVDPLIDPNEVGYVETMVGLTAGWRF